MDKNLPLQQDDELPPITHPGVPDVERNVALSTIQDNDLKIATMHLKGIQAAWGTVNSVNKLFRLMREEREAVKFRREVLGLEYGSKGSGTRQSDFDPLG